MFLDSTNYRQAWASKCLTKRSFGRSLRCASFTPHSLNVGRHNLTVGAIKLPTKFPIGVFERTVNWSLKMVGAVIVGLWVGLAFLPGVLVTFVLSYYMPTEAAAAFGSLAWGMWIIFWTQAGKFPQVRVISAQIDTAVKLCFRADDPRFFEDQKK